MTFQKNIQFFAINFNFTSALNFTSHPIVMIIESLNTARYNIMRPEWKKRSNFTMCNLFCSILNHMIHSSRSSFSRKNSFSAFPLPTPKLRARLTWSCAATRARQFQSTTIANAHAKFQASLQSTELGWLVKFRACVWVSSERDCQYWRSYKSF